MGHRSEERRLALGLVLYLADVEVTGVAESDSVGELAEGGDFVGFRTRPGVQGCGLSSTMPSRSRREYICPNSALPSSSQ